MDYEVKPGEGVGLLSFNMTREEAINVIGKPVKRVGDKEYYEGGVYLDMDKEGKLALVEFLGPQSPVYDGDKLLTVDPETWLGGKDEDADTEPPMYISEKLGISFYRTEAGSQSVGVFRPGYYD